MSFVSSVGPTDAQIRPHIDRLSVAMARVVCRDLEALIRQIFPGASGRIEDLSDPQAATLHLALSVKVSQRFGLSTPAEE